MTETALAKEASKSLALGIGTESFYAELVKLARPEDRELVARAANLNREYSAVIRRVGDALEELLQRQHTTNEPITSRESKIVQVVARKHRVTAAGIENACANHRLPQTKYLKLRGLWPSNGWFGDSHNFSDQIPPNVQP
jgi:hypothetical protein